MANRQVIFSIKSLGISKIGEQSFIPIHGLQSAGLDTTFNLEQAFEFGQAEVYENIENIPDVQITMQKVLDGYPLMWHLATRGATTPSLQGRGSIACIAAMAIFDDTKSSASGTPITLVQMSGMYPANVAYNMSVDGNFTEDMTLIGNHRAWTSTGPYVFSGVFYGDDTPLALTSGWGGVQRRENFSWDYTTNDLDANGQVNETAKFGGTVLPPDIAGISSSGTNNQINGGTEYSCSVQSVNVSVDFGRTDLFELGRKLSYHKFINPQTPVTTTVTINAKNGDQVSCDENSSLSNRSIYIHTEEGTCINVGTKNKLQSVSMAGGDSTGGGLDTITYTFQNFNFFTVLHPSDPSGF